MKSTKVQNPRRILPHAHCVQSCELCQCACAEIGHALHCSCNAWCCQFSLQQGLVWAGLNAVDDHWAGWVFPCSPASITVNTNMHAHHFCYEENGVEHYGDPSRSQQRSIFRETPQIFQPSLPTEYMTAFSGRTDTP